MSAPPVFLGNVSVENGRIRGSFMVGEDRVVSFELEPEVAADLGYALISAAVPSAWARVRGAWRNRLDGT